MLVLVSGGSRAGPGGLESSLILGESKKKIVQGRNAGRASKRKTINKQTKLCGLAVGVVEKKNHFGLI